jgi:peptidoglycan/LPS O-acetylase OafA/YrhL
VLERSFDPRGNSFSLLRLVFAGMVLFDHAFPLGGWNGGASPLQTWTSGTESFGGLAVLGFFVISGFLVTRSFVGSANGVSYVWKRFLRIFPGFWVCLIVTAVLIGPLAFVYEHGTLHGYVRGYVDSPVNYVTHNALLSMNQYGIDSLLGKNPFPHAFDGSLWTLIYEFKCYLGVLALGVFGVFRRGRLGVLALSVALWALQLQQSLEPKFLKGVFVLGDPYMVRLAFIFSLGMLFYLYRDRVIVSRSLAVAALVMFIVSLKTPLYYGIGEVMWAYLCIWAAVRLPFHGADRYGDFSYGLYIYAFVVQQMLALYGITRWGFVPYVVLSLLGTMLLAAASWFAVERPCMRLKSFRLPRRRAQWDASRSDRPAESMPGAHDPGASAPAWPPGLSPVPHSSAFGSAGTDPEPGRTPSSAP